MIQKENRNSLSLRVKREKLIYGSRYKHDHNGNMDGNMNVYMDVNIDGILGGIGKNKMWSRASDRCV